MKFKFRLLLINVLSLVSLSVVIVVSSILILNNEMSERIEETLKTAVEGYTDNVNYLKESGSDIEITVFEGNTRVESSIEGVVGTTADYSVVDVVIEQGRTYFVTDITVGGKAFYGYYKPIEGGMLFSGKPREVVTSLLVKLAMIMVGITIVVCAVAVIIVAFVATKLSNTLLKSKEQISTIADLDLTPTMDETVTVRKDEFGDMGRAVEKLHNNLTKIVQKLTEQSSHMNEISKSSEQLAAIAQENAASSQEVSASMSTLAGVVEECKVEVDKLYESSKALDEEISKFQA